MRRLFGRRNLGAIFLPASCCDVHIPFLAWAKLLPGDRRLGCRPCYVCCGSFRVQVSFFCSEGLREFRYQCHVQLFSRVLIAQYPGDLGGCRYFIIRNSARTTQAGRQSVYPVASIRGPSYLEVQAVVTRRCLLINKSSTRASN